MMKVDAKKFRETILEAARFCSVIKKNGKRHEFTNISFRMRDGKMEITSGTWDLRFYATISVEPLMIPEIEDLKTPLDCDIRGSLMKNIVNQIPKETKHLNIVQFQQNGRQLLYICGDEKSNFSFALNFVKNPGEFTTSFYEKPQHSGDVEVVLQKRDISNLRYVNGFSMTGSDARIRISGVHLKSDHGNLYFEATDGFCAARIWAGELNQSTSVDILIPASAINKIFSKIHPGCKIRIYSNEFVIVEYGNGWMAMATCIQESFPEIIKLYPEKTNFEFSVNKAYFLQEINTLGIISDYCVFHFEEDKINATTSDFADGTGDSTILMNVSAGKLDNVYLNLIFLKRIFRFENGERMYFKMAANNAPLQIFPGDAEESVLDSFLLMPMHTPQ